ncbi:MAG: hypothetical protein J07HB67_01622 [halophilic archaeon J07HB67]|jgi:hypothetical protein|nr:MAG: hypothetical protein J07HB67_01622 [halophilic archaeon J07HB67]
MHFDSRTQAALREAGLSTAEIREAADGVVDRVRRDADDLGAFFDGGGDYHTDLDLAHDDADTVERHVEWIDLYTHAADIRGYLRFDGWGVPVEGGRVLDRTEGDDSAGRPQVVELTLGGSVGDRVRFATEAEAL